jgi:hypothetical protein
VSIWPSSSVLSIILLESDEEEEERNDRVDERKDSS